MYSIPKKYRYFIKDFYEDDDGWWIVLNSDGPYYFEGYFSDYTIHEDTKSDAIREFNKYITKRH